MTDSPFLQGLLHRLQQVLVGLPLVFEGQASVGDMVEVLQPLKVGHGDTTSVDVHVWDDKAAVCLQDCISSRCHRSVGGLSDDFGLDSVSVALVDDLLHGGRDEDVTGLVHDVLSGVGLGPREAHDGAVLQLPVLQGLGVDAVRVEFTL